ncbi:neutrophil gelatinase-associated lipocalin-like [Octodon degus]|uniref:Neutrophil gelatinase-associated lipocalin-like n=1 Tax=Octodon degus TaxID=10160 RepID=A0A6P3VD27_OCTDE|nr:neutrophil gelatinase-associated lipocalin-like [Octodon degus]
MVLALLWMSLTLLGALQSQASGKLHVPKPMHIVLSKIRLQPNFMEDRFQGKWYALAVAENTIRNGSESQFQMYSITFDLNKDHSYSVSTKTQRGQDCQNWDLTFVPSHVRGQFDLGHKKLYPGIQTYTMRVSSTDYNQYALVFLKMKFKNHLFYETTLYGRTKELNTDLKERFIDFVTDIGYDNENIIIHDSIGKD